MRKIFLLLFISSSALSIAQPTVQWANRVVRYSSQYQSEFFSAKQVLGVPNAEKGGSTSMTSWMPKEMDSPKDEYVHVEFGIPMRVKQFAIVESLNPGAISEVILFDTKGRSHVVYEKKSFRNTYALDRMFTQKIPYTDYKVKGLKVIIKPSVIKGPNQIDAIAISNTDSPIKVKVNTLEYKEPVELAENLGKEVNSRYADRLPVISPDGRTLYFARKWDPRNIQSAKVKDERDIKDDVWVAKKYADGTWINATNIGEPLNNELNNYVVAVSPDNRFLYLSNAYKNQQNGGVAVSEKRGGKWSKPRNLDIKNMYNRNKFANYHVSVNGDIILMAIERDDTQGDLDLYVSFKQGDGTWSEPRNLGLDVNSLGMESSVFLAADNKTIYFSSNGFPGYGGLDMFMSRRLDNTWQNWSKPINLGAEINTPVNDYNYTIPASGEYAYFSSDYRSYGASDLFRVRLPKEVQPEPTFLVDSEPDDAIDEELDGDLAGDVAGDVVGKEVATVESNPRLQSEVDALKEKLRRLNEELDDIEKNKEEENDEKVATVQIPKEQPKEYTPTSPKSDPELERLKFKYNRHINEEEPSDSAQKGDIVENKTTPQPPKKTQPDDELEALKQKMLKLQGKVPDEAPKVTTNDVPDTPNTPTTPPSEKPTTAVTDDPLAPQPVDEEPKEEVAEEVAKDKVEVEKLREEIRQQLREELRNDVKTELKGEMIGDVRDEVAEEIRLDLEDDIKQQVEDDLKKSLQEDVKTSLREDLKEDVKDNLRDELKDDVEANLRKELENELRDELRDEVEKELKKELADEVRMELRKKLEYRLKKELEAQIRRELEEKIRAQLEEEYAQNPDKNDVPKKEEVLVVPIKVGQIIPMNNIFFDANKTTLKPASFTELEKVVDFLKAHPNLIVEVGGHTNGWCSHDFANELSTGRAKIVREYLTEKGIAQTRIKHHGYGKTNPIADNNTVHGRKKNQRVELKILEILE